MFDYSQRKNTPEYREGYERIFGKKRKNKSYLAEENKEWREELRDKLKKGIKE